MEEKDYLKDISEIRNMMAKSSQFISLSGMSGVLAGCYALAGAYLAHHILSDYHVNYLPTADNQDTLGDVIFQFMAIATTVIFFSLITGIILSTRKAKKVGDSIWTDSSKRLLINFMVPLFIGGCFALLLLAKEYFDLIAPVTLLFYGLACVNAGKYTFRDVRYLGITLSFLGLIATAFPQYSLLLWAIGFGFCHIIYGLIMHFKYDTK